jgi:acyl-CoA synthetase (AMP-forming)/AMP-acid ligase II/pimeloyl-ACP methyl ester carboxylesterase
MELSSYLNWPSKFINIAGYRWHYVEANQDSSDVVILLHGNPTWCYYYRHLIGQLQSNFRVIAPDMLGCGWSDHPSVSFRAIDRIGHLVEFINILGIKRFSLVLHDWGGPIGTGAALELMDRVNKIVYLNTTLTEIESLPSMIKTAANPVLGPILTQYTKRFIGLLLKYGVVRRLSKEEWQGYVAPYATVKRRRAIWDFVKDIPFSSDHPTYQTLNRLGRGLPGLAATVPVQIIWGLKDPCFHAEMLEKVASHFPQAKVHEFSDASHLVLEDKPEDAGALIKDFLCGRKEDIFQSAVNIQGTVEEQGAPQANLSGKVSALWESFTTIADSGSSTVKAVIETVPTKSDLSTNSLAYQSVSFAGIKKLAMKYGRGLRHLGLEPGDRVVFLVPAGKEFLALVYGVLACGGVPVFIDPGVGRKHLIKCIRDTKPQAFISVMKGHLIKILARDAFSKCKFHLTVSNWNLPGVDYNLHFLNKFSSSDFKVEQSSGVELIAFTSGATGTPKGVVYTREGTQHLLNTLITVLDFKTGDVDMPLLPIFSIFNIALGVTTVLPLPDGGKPLSLDAALAIRVMQDNRCNSSFGSPTLWHKLAEYCSRNGIKLPEMRRLLIAGAPVTDQVLQSIAKVIDPALVFTPYGATECLPVTLISARERLSATPVSALTGEQGVLVGKPIRGVDVMVIEHDSEGDIRKLGARIIGDILVSGGHVSPSYLHRPDAVKRGKVLIDGVLWHRMGDVGYFDDDGNIYYCGRAVHIVSVAGQNKYSVPIENIFNAHSKVRRSALVRCALVRCGGSSDLGGSSDFGEPGIVIEPYPEFFPNSKEEKKSFISELRSIAEQSPLTQDITAFFFHPSFPVDGRHNAKIFRDVLGQWATEERERDPSFNATFKGVAGKGGS